MSMLHAEWYEKASLCNKRKVGAVVVSDKGNLLSWGVNHGLGEVCNCDMNAKNPNVIHAEVMAIENAPPNAMVNGSIYVTYMPCLDCAKKIVDAGIIKVVYRDESNNVEGRDYLQKYYVTVTKSE